MPAKKKVEQEWKRVYPRPEPPHHRFEHDKKLDKQICSRCGFTLGAGNGKMPECPITKI